MTKRLVNAAGYSDLTIENAVPMVGERIRRRRMERAVSQVELSKKAGISQSTITQLERGHKDPTLSTLMKIASALDIHITELFASSNAIVFNLGRLTEEAKTIDDLQPETYASLDKITRFAKKIDFIK